MQLNYWQYWKYADLHFFYRNYKKFCEDEISAIGNWMEWQEVRWAGNYRKDCNKALNDIYRLCFRPKIRCFTCQSVQEYDNVNLDTPSARNSFLQGLQTPNVGNSSYQYCLGVLTQGSTPDGYIAVISQRHEMQSRMSEKCLTISLVNWWYKILNIHRIRQHITHREII